MSHQIPQGNQTGRNQAAAIQAQLQGCRQEVLRLQQHSATLRATIYHQSQTVQGHHPGMSGAGGFRQPPLLRLSGNQTGDHQPAPLHEQLRRSQQEIQRLRQQITAQETTIDRHNRLIHGHRPSMPGSGSFPQQSGNQVVGQFTLSGRVQATKALLERSFRMAHLWSVAHINIFHDQRWVVGMPPGHLAVFADPVQNNDPEELWRLLGHNDTRPLLGQRYIVEWTLFTLVRVTCLAGFPPARALDNKILQNTEATYDNTPQALRSHYTTDSARCLQEISRLPGFQQHLQSRSQYHGDLLWELLRGMMYRKTTADWTDLQEYMKEAQKLPLQMFQGAEQYSSQYFNPGIPFNAAKMDNKTPALAHLTPQQLQAQKRVVRLVMTPMIEVGIPNANGAIQRTAIVKAGVYLWY